MRIANINQVSSFRRRRRRRFLAEGRARTSFPFLTEAFTEAAAAAAAINDSSEYWKMSSERSESSF